MFKDYLKTLRMGRNITLRGFADKVGIAPSYMSDIEKGYRGVPSDEILTKIVEVLNLTNEEKTKFYDLAANSKDTIPTDIATYVKNNESVKVALRKASNLNLNEKEWFRIIKELEDKEKNDL